MVAFHPIRFTTQEFPEMNLKSIFAAAAVALTGIAIGAMPASAARAWPWWVVCSAV